MSNEGEGEFETLYKDDFIEIAVSPITHVNSVCAIPHESHDCFCITPLISSIHSSIFVLTALKSIFYIS